MLRSHYIHLYIDYDVGSTSCDKEPNETVAKISSLNLVGLVY